MRYFQVVHSDHVEVVSEEEIRNTFFQHWKKDKAEPSFEQCLAEWKNITEATEVEFIG